MTDFHQDLGRVEGKLDLVLEGLGEIKSAQSATAATVSEHSKRLDGHDSFRSQVRYVGGAFVSALLAAAGYVGPHLQDLLLKR